MRLSYSIIDAFTKAPFTGNPAAVFLLESTQQIDDGTLQLIAREINFSETAFAWPLGEPGHYRLRWMMPLSEAPICGHATLATSHALFQRCPQLKSLTFETLAGTLHAHRVGDMYELDFPADQGVTLLPDKEAAEARSIWLKAAPRLSEGRILSLSRDMSGTICCVELPDELELKDLPITSSILAPLDEMVMTGLWNTDNSQKEAAQIKITCRAPAGSERDFDSRVLCPTDGIDEDPVTGSAYVCHVPLRLGLSMADTARWDLSGKLRWLSRAPRSDHSKHFRQALAVVTSKLSLRARDANSGGTLWMWLKRQ